MKYLAVVVLLCTESTGKSCDRFAVPLVLTKAQFTGVLCSQKEQEVCVCVREREKINARKNVN